MKYKIAVRESEEGFSVSVPGLPGCWSQGATEQEALATVEDLLEGATVREIEVSA
jgi:predicted RNase H-like HicB family nuclease